MATTIRSTGRIASWDEQRGCGSIVLAAEQREVLMNIGNWTESDAEPRAGQRVSFVEATTRNGQPVARSVRRCAI
jgi:hypothetical protein